MKPSFRSTPLIYQTKYFIKRPQILLKSHKQLQCHVFKFIILLCAILYQKEFLRLIKKQYHHSKLRTNLPPTSSLFACQPTSHIEVAGEHFSRFCALNMYIVTIRVHKEITLYDYITPYNTGCC